MKILICTQVIDKNDTALSFFHRWVEEFAKKSEKVTVICLKKGSFSFPSNVEVLSLGKEDKKSQIVYIFRFLKYIWHKRDDYNSVFVHMNQEYVLLGGLVWKILGKKVFMWRNHPYGNLLTRIAVVLADKVFCTSPKSFTAKFSKTKIMPAGIDLKDHLDLPNPEKNNLLFFGRLSQVKNVDVFIEALRILDSRGINFRASIIGSPANPEDFDYEEKIKNLGKDLVNKNKLEFLSGVPHTESVEIYKKHYLYVNLSPDGSLDKTMFESMASGTPVLVFNSAFRDVLPDECEVRSLSPEEVALKIESFLNLEENRVDHIRRIMFNYVKTTHSLSKLVSSIFHEINLNS